jgi:hypothetical protein
MLVGMSISGDHLAIRVVQPDTPTGAHARVRASPIRANLHDAPVLVELEQVGRAAFDAVQVDDFVLDSGRSCAAEVAAARRLPKAWGTALRAALLAALTEAACTAGLTAALLLPSAFNLGD